MLESEVAEVFRGFSVRGSRFALTVLDDSAYVAEGEIKPTFQSRLFATDGSELEVREQVVWFGAVRERSAARLAAHLVAIRTLLWGLSFEALVDTSPDDVLFTTLLSRDLEPAAVDRILADPRARALLQSNESENLAIVLDPADRRPPALATHAELEASLLSTDDSEIARVYADWLAERGDPRGELITLQLAREHADSEQLRARERELIAEYQFEWLGGLAWLPAELCEVTFRRGFPHRVRIGYRTMRDEDFGDVSPRELHTLPKYDHVRELVVHLRSKAGPTRFAQELVAPAKLESLAVEHGGAPVRLAGAAWSRFFARDGAI